MAINYWHEYEEDFYYHLYNRCVSGVNIFETEDNCQFFLEKFKRYLTSFISVSAFCLMPNHFHFLIRVKRRSELDFNTINFNESKKLRLFLKNEIGINELIEDQFRRLFSSFALRYNKINGRRGAIFTERMKRISLHSEIKILDLLCYIHHNPIYHEFASNYISWKYSSYNSFLSESYWFAGQKELMVLHLKSLNEFKEIHHEYQHIIKEGFEG